MYSINMRFCFIINTPPNKIGKHAASGVLADIKRREGIIFTRFRYLIMVLLFNLRRADYGLELPDFQKLIQRY